MLMLIPMLVVMLMLTLMIIFMLIHLLAIAALSYALCQMAYLYFCTRQTYPSQLPSLTCPLMCIFGFSRPWCIGCGVGGWVRKISLDSWLIYVDGA